MLRFSLPLTLILLFIADIIIYRNDLRDKKRWVRRLYVWQAVGIYLLLGAALTLYDASTDMSSDAYMKAIIWILWAFALTSTGKISYFVVSFAGYVFRRKRRYRTAGVFAAGLVAAVMIAGATVWRTHLRVTHVEITYPALPASFDGMRIVFFSDLHIGNLMNPVSEIKEIAERIDLLHPDIVVFGGDLVNIKSSELTPEIVSALSLIRAPKGVYAVLGNHDYGMYVKDKAAYPMAATIEGVLDGYRAMGWTPLVNESVRVGNATDTITVSGVAYPVIFRRAKGRAGDILDVDYPATYADVPDSLFNITIAHTPDSWDRLLSIGHADLTLSGHTHAMQFKIPLGKRGWSPAAWRHKYWSGLYERDERALYVNDGVGYVLYPMRIGAGPEITLITLRSEQQ